MESPKWMYVLSCGCGMEDCTQPVLHEALLDTPSFKQAKESADVAAQEWLIGGPVHIIVGIAVPLSKP